MSDATKNVTEYLFQNMSFEDLRHKGNLLLEENNYSEANRYFTKALERQPNNLFAYLNKAIAQQALGEYKQAIEDYTKALERNPILLGRAYCYGKIGEYKKAIEDYTNVILLNPYHSNYAYYNRAVEYQRIEEFGKAIKDYTVWLDRYSHHPLDTPVSKGAIVAISAYKNRGICHHNLKNYRKAIEDYNKVIEIDPLSKEAEYIMGNLDVLTGLIKNKDNK
jgi:tetratricopeptide (TPR) repeat protein